MAEGASQRPDRFSYYYLTLDKIPQARYREKLAMLGDIEDPYFTLDTRCSSEQGIEWQNWPNVLYPDIYNYFIETPSEYTKQELKAYKSLDGYKYFVDGWVSDILVLPLSSRPNVCLTSCKVKHSQRLSAAPLQPWVAVEKDGLVVCAHCNCMAGLGEACSHIAALLFTLEANSQVKKSLSCTSLPCYWLPPTFKSVPFARICDIDFTAPQTKQRKLCDDQQVSTPPASIPTSDMKPSASELNSFFKTLSETGKPAILSIVPGFCEAYVPLQVKGDLPSPLSNLHNESFLNLTYPALLSKCEEAYEDLSICSNQAELVENKPESNRIPKFGSSKDLEE